MFSLIKDMPIYQKVLQHGEPNFAPTNMDDQSILAILEHKINDNWKFTGQASYFNYKQEGMSMWPQWPGFAPELIIF